MSAFSPSTLMAVEPPPPEMTLTGDAAVRPADLRCRARDAALQQAASYGIRVRSYFGRLFSLPYTAVETSPDKLGRLAVQALVQRMTDPLAASAPRVALVAPHITDRGSTR